MTLSKRWKLKTSLRGSFATAAITSLILLAACGGDSSSSKVTEPADDPSSSSTEADMNAEADGDESSSSVIRSDNDVDRSSSSSVSLSDSDGSSGSKVPEPAEGSSSSSSVELNCSALLEGNTGWSWDVPKECRFNPDITYGTMTDSRDGQTYKTVKIGDQTWMAENLNYADSINTPSLLERSWCYNDKKDNCKKFGRLYSYEQAKEICPEGWHLPSSNEYSQLMQFAKTTGNLRSRDEWTDKGGKGINFWGFNALPAGGREDGDFFDLRVSSYMWTSNKEAFWLRYYDDNFNLLPKDEKTAFSVRCIEDVQTP